MTSDDRPAPHHDPPPACFPEWDQDLIRAASALLDVEMRPGRHIMRTSTGLKGGELLVDSTLAILIDPGAGAPITLAGVRHDQKWSVAVATRERAGLISHHAGDVGDVLGAWPLPKDVEGGILLDGLRIWMHLEGLASQLCASVGLSGFDEESGNERLVRALSNLLLNSPIGGTWIARAGHAVGDVLTG